MAGTKTDNHYTADKVALRAGNIPDKKEIRVLDCFGGRGVIWRAVARKTGKNIIRTAIDMRSDIDYVHLHGDNTKVIKSIDLKQFDVIDLDAYGVPADIIKTVQGSDFSGVVFVTMIQTMFGAIPRIIQKDLKMPDSVKKIPSLVAKDGWNIFLNWLGYVGVKRIKIREKNRKRYFCYTKEA